MGGLNKNRHADKKHINAVGNSDKSVVLGAVCITGKVKTLVVTNTEIKTLLPIIEKWVGKGSIMVTDEARQYHSSLKESFFHVSINHGASQYASGCFTTNNIENFWSTFKRGIIGIYHFVSPQHLQRYATEFEYRYNNRKDAGADKFVTTIAGADNKRLKYDMLIGK